jgi:Domain of unknown function (DUF4136)
MRIKNLALLFTLASLGGCVASIPPVEVTRFHQAEQIQAGSVRVETVQTMEAAAYAAAVARGLGTAGFSAVAPPAPADFVAKVTFSQGSRTEQKRSPVSIGVGGGTGGSGIGVGIGTSIGLGGGAREIIITQLSVQLLRTKDAKPVWEGRAQTEAPRTAPASQPGLAADKLARALFSGFPGESGKTVLVH